MMEPLNAKKPRNAEETLAALRIPRPSQDPEYALTHEQVLALQQAYTPLQAGGYTQPSVYRLAERLSDTVHSPDIQMDLFALVRGLGGRVSYLPYHQYRAEDGSVFIHDKGEFDVILSDAVSATRNRFTLAHELGHRILHQPETCSFAKRFESTPVEWEANWFAAGFLMPKQRFLAAAQKYQNNSYALASQFGVSEESARIRLEVLLNKEM